MNQVDDNGRMAHHRKQLLVKLLNTKTEDVDGRTASNLGNGLGFEKQGRASGITS